MGVNVSRYVEIQISNKTRNITLENPRTHFFSGHILNQPPNRVRPGSSHACKFTNRTLFWGCNGVLAFEAKSFTLAIYFSNPVDYNRFSPEMGLELSQDKVHKGDLRATYDLMIRSSFSNTSGPHHVIVKEHQEQAELSAGPVKVTATMAGTWSVVIKVVLEEREGAEKEAPMETPSPGRHVQEK